MSVRTKRLFVVAIAIIMLIAICFLIYCVIDGDFFNKDKELVVQTVSETDITTVTTTKTQEVTEPTTTSQQTQVQTKETEPSKQIVTTATTQKTTKKQTTPAKQTTPQSTTSGRYTPQNGGFNVGTEGLGNPNATGTVSGLH